MAGGWIDLEEQGAADHGGRERYWTLGAANFSSLDYSRVVTNVEPSMNPSLRQWLELHHSEFTSIRRDIPHNNSLALGSSFRCLDELCHSIIKDALPSMRWGDELDFPWTSRAPITRRFDTHFSVRSTNFIDNHPLNAGNSPCYGNVILTAGFRMRRCLRPGRRRSAQTAPGRFRRLRAWDTRSGLANRPRPLQSVHNLSGRRQSR